MADYRGTIYTSGFLMTSEEIRKRRLHNQKLLNPTLTEPEKVVSYMAAMQAQEFAMAKWAIALRIENGSDEMVEKAFNDGLILRTHTMRPTWHFIAHEDIRWMLGVTAPRVITMNAFMYRKLELDDKIFTKSLAIIEKSLGDNNYLTREALKEILASKGIECDGMRMAHIMMQGELTGLVCSGPREANQFTYALIDERAPNAKKLAHEEALGELCRRYFTSRGPAMLKDFTNWSGLTVKEARQGIGMIEKKFEAMTIDGVTYYFIGEKPSLRKQVSFLMPDYDEYGMSYKDRSVLINPGAGGSKNQFDRVIIINGMIAGTWRRTLRRDTVQLELQLYRPYIITDKIVTKLLKDYSKFLNKKIEII